MKRPVLNADTGAAFGLIAGIVLGSLALNLSGAADPPRTVPNAPGQSAPRTAAISGAASGAADASQR
jgi:hypothetical protein